MSRLLLSPLSSCDEGFRPEFLLTAEDAESAEKKEIACAHRINSKEHKLDNQHAFRDEWQRRRLAGDTLRIANRRCCRSGG